MITPRAKRAPRLPDPVPLPHQTTHTTPDHLHPHSQHAAHALVVARVGSVTSPPAAAIFRTFTPHATHARSSQPLYLTHH
jgi:hypothetical protein